MTKVKYIIIGAGPSGLTLAHTLHDRGVPLSEILVLEKETTAGGLCRSETVDGSPLDIGGGHFLDVKHRDVLDFVFRFLPESEWNRYERISKINLRGQLISHPLEANLWEFDVDTQVDYLESIARAGCTHGTPKPELFAEWIQWKFGERIAHDYMLPYNRKIWGMHPDLLGTYWLYKLPNVSFRETLQSCLTGKPYGCLPAHGVFLYPKKHGYGEVWDRMGKALGDSLQLGTTIDSVDPRNLIVNGRWKAQYLFNSAPWHCWKNWSSIPEAITEDINNLHHVGIVVDYVSETLTSNAHWIYEPDETLPHHRKLLRANFCTNARGHWTETNATRLAPQAGWRHTNPFAYPVNSVDKPLRIARVLNWAEANGIIGFGRWGAWEHMNSDIAVKSAISLGVRYAKI
jgi:protoporphyrinogen oxidase